MDGHEIFRVSTQSTDITFTGGEMKIKETGTSSGIAVRALHGGKLGFAYSQGEPGLGKALEEAKNLSRFSLQTGFAFSPKAHFQTPDLADRSLDPDDLLYLKSIVDAVREAASSKGGRPRVMCQAGKGDISLENTSGFSGAYAKTSFSLFVECMHGDGYGMSYLTSNWKPKDPETHGHKAAEMAVATQNAGKPESGTYTVVMEVEALESLIGTLLPSLSGDWKRRKMTKLSAGKKAFSDQFTIMEDGTAPGSDARPFDDEGTPSVPRTLVGSGVVHSFLYDRETAALEGIQGSGACSRDSFESPPSIGASNLVISPGSWKDLNDIDRFIEVHYAHGSHTANLTTGDIGLEVSAAFMVEKGKRKPLKGFMLSGNVFDMFADIEAIEARQHAIGSLIAPRIAFKGMRVIS
jgi:PmbA protein